MCSPKLDVFAQTYVFAQIGLGVFIIGAHTQVHPYVNNDGMKMIGHYNVCAQFNIRKFIRRFQTPFFNHFTGVVQYHFSVRDVPETAYLVLTTYRNEIHPCLRIIVSFQADAATVVDVRIVGHVNNFNLRRKGNVIFNIGM
jgi:hypothetical protein